VLTRKNLLLNYPARNNKLPEERMKVILPSRKVFGRGVRGRLFSKSNSEKRGMR
jgi:DUF971 family protein